MQNSKTTIETSFDYKGKNIRVVTNTTEVDRLGIEIALDGHLQSLKEVKEKADKVLAEGKH